MQYTFTGTSSTNWSDPLNWLPSLVPPAGSKVAFANLSNFQVNVDNAVTVGAIVIKNSTGQQTSITFSGNQITLIYNPIMGSGLTIGQSLQVQFLCPLYVSGTFNNQTFNLNFQIFGESALTIAALSGNGSLSLSHTQINGVSPTCAINQSTYQDRISLQGNDGANSMILSIGSKGGTGDLSSTSFVVHAPDAIETVSDCTIQSIDCAGSLTVAPNTTLTINEYAHFYPGTILSVTGGTLIV